MALSPPHLSDKLIDWRLIENAGGQGIFAEKDVIDFGPSYGLDMITWSFFTRSYTVVESAPDVLVHIRALRALFRERDIAIVEANLREPLTFGDGSYDVVIDFGTVDNLINGVEPYREAWRLLRPGGILLTTYANMRYFNAAVSDCGDEHRFDPDALFNFFVDELGAQYITHAGNVAARASLAVRKPPIDVV